MRQHYDKLINFCEAEVVTGKTHWVQVEEYPNHYKILFICLRHSVDILKPSRADANDIEEAGMYGYMHLPYREQPIWPDLVCMLGLMNPWKRVVDTIVPDEKPLIGYASYDEVYRNKKGVSQASGWTQEYSLGYFRNGYWYYDGGVQRSPAYVMDLPPAPTDDRG